MGGLCHPIQTNTTSASEVLTDTQIPQWVSEGGQELFNQAKFLAETPFDPYGGARVADFSTDEQTAFGQMRDIQGDYFNPASSMIQSGGQTWSQDAADQYMNPYQSNVTDVTTRELNRQFDLQRQAENARAAQSSAFGGTRHALLEAENERNRNMTISDTLLRGQAGAYENAQQAFQADQIRRMQGGSALGQLGTLASRGATDLATMGGLQRGLEQASLDTAYKDYVEQREYPYQQTNFAIGALKGIPYSQHQTQVTTANTPQLTTSPLGQTAGALTGLYGAYNLFNQPGAIGGTP